MALKDFPELYEVFKKLMEEKDAIVAKSKPYRDEYEKLQGEIAPLDMKMRDLAKKFHEIERPRLIEIDQQLAAISRATGGVQMSQPPAEPS